jgi:hypothetical protein
LHGGVQQLVFAQQPVLAQHELAQQPSPSQQPGPLLVGNAGGGCHSPLPDVGRWNPGRGSGSSANGESAESSSAAGWAAGADDWFAGGGAGVCAIRKVVRELASLAGWLLVLLGVALSAVPPKIVVPKIPRAASAPHQYVLPNRVMSPPLFERKLQPAFPGENFDDDGRQCRICPTVEPWLRIGTGTNGTTRISGAHGKNLKV